MSEQLPQNDPPAEALSLSEAEGESLPVDLAPFSAHEIPLNLLMSNNAAATDDAPTIISKLQPAQALTPTATATTGNQIRGRKLAHFELLEPIGVGGMAAVLRARDTLLDRIVALKILPPAMAVDAEHVNRFHQEARAAAKLDHENIARVYYCGEDQRLHFIAFEFVEGQNLRMVLDRCGLLPIKDALHYLLQIAAGLAHAAARGVVHRDIKPSNIIITPTGRAKLVDMGLARSLGPHDKRQLTQSGVTLGTFDYISPEQALEPRDADVRSDMYSLGCTFYHMLTGQPPVPDGTAAKKLHHHQYVAPIDPRQLNPEVPNEVAAILQKMMAKEPKERYQRAEQLIQHLVYVAQKLGVAEVPTQGILVEAPLPSPPRKRPVVFAAAAFVLLAIFVGAVALFPPTRYTVQPPRFKPNMLVGKDEKSLKGSPAAAGAKEPVALLEKRTINNEFEWAEALSEDRPLKLVLQQDLHIFETDMVYRGGTSGKRSLDVDSADPSKPATINFNYAPDAENPGLYWAGLVIEGGNVIFRNIHFTLHAGHTPRQLAAGLLVKAGQVQFEKCTFSQRTPLEEELIGRRHLVRPIASVGVWETKNAPPVVFRQCYFADGQAAVSVKGSGRIEQANCAFGPHSCLFHLWGQDKYESAELSLRSISAQVTEGPVFRIDEDVSCTLMVHNSIFCGPIDSSSLERSDLIRQTDNVRSVVYKGRHNAYYQLTSYWARPSGPEETEGDDWSSFRNHLANSDSSDMGSTQLKGSPWSKPNPGVDDDPKVTFLVDDNLPELRQENDRKRPIGVEVCVWGEMYPKGLRTLEQPRPSENVAKLGPKERLVDPSGVLSGERIHKRIEAAIREAANDEVILIKHTGELKVEPTTLMEQRRIKLRPYGDSQPILVLGKTTENSTSFFHVRHGQIEFEQIEFLLRPEANHRSLAIVSIGGDSTCIFNQCVLTLDNADNPGVDLEAVALLEPLATVKATTNESKIQSELRFRNCFIRGRGNLVAVKTNRAVDLRIDKSLLCLTGSLVDIHSGGDISAETKSRLLFDQSTLFFGEPVLRFVCAKRGVGLAFTQVTANHCLFAMGGTKPLVRVNGLDNENQLKNLLAWTGSSNAFVGYEKLLELGSVDGDITFAYQSEDWKLFVDAGSDSRFDRGALQPWVGVERSFSHLMPLDFAVRSDLANYGAQAETLPRPASEAGGEFRLRSLSRSNAQPGLGTRRTALIRNS